MAAIPFICRYSSVAQSYCGWSCLTAPSPINNQSSHLPILQWPKHDFAFPHNLPFIQPVLAEDRLYDASSCSTSLFCFWTDSCQSIVVAFSRSDWLYISFNFMVGLEQPDCSLSTSHGTLTLARKHFSSIFIISTLRSHEDFYLCYHVQLFGATPSPRGQRQRCTYSKRY